MMGMGKDSKSIQATKEKEFERFFAENYSRLYYYALHYISDSEICKDIVSESFRYLWEKLDAVRVDTMLTYMFTHVRNLCIDHIRHAEVENSYLNSQLNFVSEMDDESWKETEIRIEQIMQVLDTLPSQTKFIMEQNYLHKKKYKEIAEIVGMTESGVRKHIMKGLDTIRSYFSVKYKKGGNQK